MEIEFYLEDLKSKFRKLKNTCGYSFRYLEEEMVAYRTLGA